MDLVGLAIELGVDRVPKAISDPWLRDVTAAELATARAYAEALTGIAYDEWCDDETEHFTQALAVLKFANDWIKR